MMIGLLEYDPPQTVARRLGRSSGAVQRELRRNDTSLSRIRILAHGMSVHDVAHALGVSKSAVRQWVRAGQLASRHVRLYQRRIHVIDPDDLESWLYRRGALLALVPRDTAWSEIVSEARTALLAHLVPLADICAVLGLSEATMRSLRRSAQFPPSAVCFYGFGGAYIDRDALRYWLLDHPGYQSLATYAAFGV